MKTLSDNSVHIPHKITASLTDQVYHDLRMSIITGEIKGRTRLVESTIAEAMKVSRTPVREALHKLALEAFYT